MQLVELGIRAMLGAVFAISGIVIGLACATALAVVGLVAVTRAFQRESA